MSEERPESARAKAFQEPWWLLALVVVAVTARLALSCVSWGSNDARLWDFFTRALERFTFSEVYQYQQQPVFNHPPLSAGLGLLIREVSDWTGVWFPFAWRLPQLAAEVSVFVLVVRRWRGSGLARFALVAALLNLCGAWVSAHHGNTDWLCAALAAWGVYLLETRSGPRGCLVAGLVVGLAINVKLIPGLMLPVLFTRCRSWREAALLCAGLAVCTLPFVWGVVAAGSHFVSNVLGYSPRPDAWGVAGVIKVFSGARPHTQTLWIGYYASFARLPVIGAALGFAALGWRWRATPDAGYRLCACVLAAFLVATPGFGLQYLVYLCPFALLVSPRLGAAYGLAAGAFASLVYLSFVARWFPFATHHTNHVGLPSILLGLVLWGGILWFLVRGAREAWRGPDPEPPAAPVTPQAE